MNPKVIIIELTDKLVAINDGYKDKPPIYAMKERDDSGEYHGCWMKGCMFCLQGYCFLAEGTIAPTLEDEKIIGCARSENFVFVEADPFYVDLVLSQMEDNNGKQKDGESR
jgi:hypothetical protein